MRKLATTLALLVPATLFIAGAVPAMAGSDYSGDRHAPFTRPSPTFPNTDICGPFQSCDAHWGNAHSGTPSTLIP